MEKPVLSTDKTVLAKKTVGLAESDANLPPGLWLTSPAG